VAVLYPLHVPNVNRFSTEAEIVNTTVDRSWSGSWTARTVSQQLGTPGLVSNQNLLALLRACSYLKSAKWGPAEGSSLSVPDFPGNQYEGSPGSWCRPPNCCILVRFVSDSEALPAIADSTISITAPTVAGRV
jgi:hypothetical protein